MKSRFSLRNKPDGESAPGTGKPDAKADKKRPPMLTGLFNETRKILQAVPDDWPMFSSRQEDYELKDVIGFGASSVVYSAYFKPLDRDCAIKVIDLERCSSSAIDMLRRETQLMSLSKHTNVLRVRGEWVAQSKLCIATRLMHHGSLLDIIRFAHQDGLDEVTCATILKQALCGLAYLHLNGYVHRDLKPANVLLDSDGTVLLGDFGVASLLLDGSNTNGTSRTTFVGTPLYIAPEVVRSDLYNQAADIWSLGISAIEIATGKLPGQYLSTTKQLLATVNDVSPTLDILANKHTFSKAFKDVIDNCLQKEPAKRPTAAKLLGHAFFRQARSKQHLVTQILADLPPVSERQHRRRLDSIHNSIYNDSWDFNSINTPARSIADTRDIFAGFTAALVPPSPGFSLLQSQMLATGLPLPESPLPASPADEDLPFSPRRMRHGSASDSMSRAHQRHRSVTFDTGASSVRDVYE
ncbi:uncharacterized protein L969DRAFT_60494 [Mixia osmundae IAM 14324]|uniref:Protein kinase domain-containing protein n=1 Tax=Mixia osmundae (strain CBS 9802 / IAM 14324 / JCM 22182 / KY 12970) TaxID=764103 RepID=G7E9A1_MIXOS|nr:uncharacterized protein L969DRAFT_60494 [Mixia osmundae IAM 14324]KEI39845.1 hypothetical protein L969DRAFT_60494 [Mixia osmundae IAM 14324]GAA99220.1 hypothetical protein E5Q_05913 [Mixia osmundae IAM 14324]